MLPLIATSLATVAGVMLFGGDFHRLFFVFPTYQITSFNIIDFSVSIPSWTAMNSITAQSVWKLYEETFCENKNKWQCLLWDWDGFSKLVNNVENDIMSYVTIWGEEKPRIERDVPAHASFELSAEIYAGISINNSQNSFGAHLHRAILDIYHTDWDGQLINIGSIHDRENVRDAFHESGDNTLIELPDRILPPPNDDSVNLKTLSLLDTWANTTDPNLITEETIINGFENPSFSILPRQIIHTVKDAIAIHLKSLSPKMLTHMAYQFIRNGKVLHITSTAVVYLKTLTSPMSITAGAICDNALKFTPPSINSLLFHSERNPWFYVDEVDCRIERLSTGWGNITKMRGELQEMLLLQHAKAG